MYSKCDFLQSYKELHFAAPRRKPTLPGVGATTTVHVLTIAWSFSSDELHNLSSEIAN